jgi:hypothetical protein
MRQLSAIEAIGPAWNHTHRLLFAPRRAGLLLKIGAVAVLAQAGGGFNGGGFGNHGNHANHLAPAFIAPMIAAAMLFGLIAFVIGVVLFYLRSRFQFVLFDVVLRSDTTVAPIWRRYSAATWRWIGLKLLFFCAAALCILPVAIPMVVHVVHNIPAGQHMSFHTLIPFIASMLGLIAVLVIAGLVLCITFTLIADFGLPSMALEGTSLEETVRRVGRLFRAEPGQVLLYILMRFLMSIATVFLCELIIGFGTLIALIPLGGAGFGLWAALHTTGTAGHAVMIAGWVVLGVILATLVIVAAVMLVGSAYTFLQAYALYFLGGRYPLVGQYLAPLPPAPAPNYSPTAYAIPPMA